MKASLIALAVACACGGGVWAQAPAGPDLSPWRTEDLIDERLDVDVQYSLMRMFRSEDFERTVTASDLLSALHAGELAGVVRADRRAAAALAEALGKSSWIELGPKVFQALCISPPAPTGGERDARPAPWIVYRPGLAADGEKLDRALVMAFDSCGLPRGHSIRGYVQTIYWPPPPTAVNPPDPDPHAVPEGSSLLELRVFGNGVPLEGVRFVIEAADGRRFGGVSDYRGTIAFEATEGVYQGYIWKPGFEPAAPMVHAYDGAYLTAQFDLRTQEVEKQRNCRVLEWGIATNLCVVRGGVMELACDGREDVNDELCALGRSEFCKPKRMARRNACRRRNDPPKCRAEANHKFDCDFEP